jgi:glycerophosphoryl diester phosphodiesterase
MKPLVFGHRGASGYRPENTLEAFELAFAQGSDAIELDMVPTIDGHLIIRHENVLSHTTNISDVPELAAHKHSKFMLWREVEDWFSEELTLEEIRLTRAIERIPDQRPGSAKFDGQFQIPTIDDLLAADFVTGKTLILELKYPNYFLDRGIDTPALLAASLAKHNIEERGITVSIETFDFVGLQRAKTLMPGVGKFVFLTEHWRIPKGGPAEVGQYLADIAENFDGLSIDRRSIRDIWPSVVQDAHDLGLVVFTWTARAEEAENSVDEYYADFIYTGVDGIFADQPDLLRFTVDSLT